jgi:hypothetical protein
MRQFFKRAKQRSLGKLYLESVVRLGPRLRQCGLGRPKKCCPDSRLILERSFCLP